MESDIMSLSVGEAAQFRTFTTDALPMDWIVLRVPSGWIYTEFHTMKSVFVPLPN